tara:strand:- start:47 stop:295 length:249 start_codon:yes stop_codon:yes gene_type:complete
MKDYTFKLDVNIWLDRNFTVEANSQQEAESKAKAVAKKLLEDAPDVYNGRDGGKSLELLANYLADWTFGDLRFDVVNVEEEE